MEEYIQHENEKLYKGILSQKSSYLPKINKTARSVSVAGNQSIKNNKSSELSPEKNVENQ